MNEDEIYASFAKSGLEFRKLEHPAVHTVEESAEIHRNLPGLHSKNLFLKDKTGHHWLIVLPADRRSDLKAMASLLGAGKFSFGKAEDMERLLGVTPGAVTPLGAANASALDLSVVIDAAFRDAGIIAVHPLRNTATISLSTPGLERWLADVGHAPRVVALP
jgi:Ala-tRNA(Pro) deacylase